MSCKHGIGNGCVFCLTDKHCPKCNSVMAVEVGTDIDLHYSCTPCGNEAMFIEAIKSVYAEAKYLRDSGYDGPFIGKPVEGLFNAIAKAEIWVK